MLKNNNILLIGGSGFIGSHMLEALDPDATVILDLKEPESPTAAQYISGDIRNPDDVHKAFSSRDFDIVINLAAEHKDYGLTREQYFATNVGGTENILAAAEQFGVRQYVFYSSVAVYGSMDTPSNENTMPRPDNDYGASKLAAEQAIEGWANLNAAHQALVLRPTVVYGERNTANVFRLINQIKSGRYINVGDGKNVKSVAYVKNLVDATFYLMGNMTDGVTVFNYADEPHKSVKELSAVISSALGRKPPFSLPELLVLTLAIPFEILVRVTKKDLPISFARVRKLSTPTQHSAAKLLSEGFEPTYSTESGIERMVRWMNSAA